MSRIALLAPLAVVSVLVACTGAGADSGPIGKLPAGPTTQITTKRGELIAVALPAQPNGRVWRFKGTMDVSVVREVTEADVGKNVVVVFKATGRGSTTLSYASTRGETTKAYAAKRFHVTVR